MMQDALSLNSKHAIVCGSTQGIGKAAAHLLAQAGAAVTLLARNEHALRDLAAQLPRPSGQTHGYVAADFTHPEGVIAAVTAAGLPSAHILVNNTGGPPGGPVAEATPAAFLAAFGSHLLVNHLLAQYVTPGMKAASYGRIINVVSTSVREPIKGLGVSNTVRAAVAGWAKTLATELAPFGVTVNNVLPGATRTQRLTAIIEQKMQKTGRTQAEVEAELLAAIPAGRFGQAEDIAWAIAFLASPAAGYITGVSLPVDGGRMVSI